MSTIKEYGKIGITFEGEYDPSRSYERLCIVEYSGLNFMSKVDGTTSIPTKNKDEWIQLSVPGLPGEKGEQGDKGDKGDKGDIGPRGINLKLVICYKSSETQPSPPTGGQYDFVGNTIIYPEGWSESDNIPSPIWKSEKVFYEDPALEGEWSNPMCISGKDGKPGEDGKSLEFIYYVTKKPSIKPDISNLPSENVDDYVPTLFGWTDRPQGVDPANRVEWICTRKKINGVWGAWEGPTIWSAYGEKGQDGDGVEYIFYLDSSGQPPMNPTPEDWQYNTDYQNTDVEYVPKDLGWTDVATGISIEYPYEWQCVRKFKNGFWQPFEGPYVWSRLGEKGNTGDRIIEKFAITESSSIVPTFVKDDINPGSNWTMVSPIRTKDEQAIWKIQTYVNYKNEFVEWTDEEDNVHSGWSEPILITGVNGVDAIPANYWVYIYKRQDNGSPEIPTFTDPTQFEQAGWNDIPYVDTNNDGVVDIQGIWWECAGLVNGVDETVEWKTLRQINSSTTKTLFAVNNSSTIAPDVNTNVRNPEGWSETYNKPNIYEFVWQITAEINAQDQLIGEWQGPVCISREHIEINDEGNINIGGEDTGVNVLNLHLELDNDSETIPTDSKGNTVGSISAITTAQLYNGSNIITEGVTYTAVAYKCELKENTNTTGIFEIISLDSGTDNTGYYIEITANYKDKNISKKFNISKSLGNIVYKLIFNKNIVNLNQSDKTVNIKVKYVDSNNEGFIKSLSTNSLGIKANGVLLSASDYNETTGIAITISQSTNVELYSYLFDSNGVLQDSETIGVVEDGKDGQDGADGADGKDGQDGQNGTSYYMHTAYSNNSDGTDFVYGSNVVTDYDYIGIYTGTEADQSKLVKTDYKWTKHRGDTGKRGAAGINGVSIYLRYQKGDENGPVHTNLPSTNDGSSAFWSSIIPTVTEQYPYIWCTQGQQIFISQTSCYYAWSEPFRLSGTNGLDAIGDKGDPGKIIYPAGIYANNVTYQATDKKAPYVWDPNYGAYYVYLATTPWKGTDQNNTTPGQEYEANKNSNTNKWELFEQFEAVYAKIGIIANGLIGSAVFNGDYMFSQQGYTTLTGSVPASGKSYENFNPDDPFGSNNSFYPNICFNFKTGAVWIGRNKFVVDNEGNIKLGKFNITSKGLEYELSIDGDNSLFCINEEGILLKQAGDTIYELNSNGNVKFVNENILFNKDGTWKIGNQIKYENNIIYLGLYGLKIYPNGDIIDRQDSYHNLSELTGWPALADDGISLKISTVNARNIYLYNSTSFSNSHINTNNYLALLEIGITFTQDKIIRITIPDDLGDGYSLNIKFRQYNGSTVYKIIGSSKIGSGDYIYPTTTTVDFMRCYCGYTYVFKCEMNNGYTLRYLTKF